MDSIQTVLSVLAGIGLAAACGFRVFVPLLLVSVATYAGMIDVSQGFAWLGSVPALIILSVATTLEVIAYYVPWLDNALDVIASPAAVIAGIMVTASMVTDVEPWLKWTLAVIAGGGVAGAVQTVTSGSRLMSTAVTAGIGNNVVSTAELAGSAVVSVLALLFPIAAIILVVIAFIFIVRFISKRKLPISS